MAMEGRASIWKGGGIPLFCVDVRSRSMVRQGSDRANKYSPAPLAPTSRHREPFGSFRVKSLMNGSQPTSIHIDSLLGKNERTLHHQSS